MCFKHVAVSTDICFRQCAGISYSASVEKMLLHIIYSGGRWSVPSWGKQLTVGGAGGRYPSSRWDPLRQPPRYPKSRCPSTPPISKYPAQWRDITISDILVAVTLPVHHQPKHWIKSRDSDIKKQINCEYCPPSPSPSCCLISPPVFQQLSWTSEPNSKKRWEK